MPALDRVMTARQGDGLQQANKPPANKQPLDKHKKNSRMRIRHQDKRE